MVLITIENDITLLRRTKPRGPKERDCVRRARHRVSYRGTVGEKTARSLCFVKKSVHLLFQKFYLQSLTSEIMCIEIIDLILPHKYRMLGL